MQVSVKGGTKTWSTAEQTSALKPDASKSLSANDLEKALGGQNLGEVLNKVADPNWVDPKKTRQVGGSELDKDAFMKLMLAQMKNQDPMNPMQSHEMAAQLAQFTSLEQLNNINATLEGMKNAQQPSTNYQALNFIGKKVSGDSSKLTRVAGDKFHEFNFSLMNDAASAEIKIKDAEGNDVRTLKMTNLKKGQNTISWNGLTEDGMAARPGEYRFAIEAKSSNGLKVAARTEFDGKITGLNFTAEGPVLMVGQQTVKLSDVKKIYEPSPEEALMQRTIATPMQMPPQASAAGAAQAPAAGAAPGKPAADVPAASDDEPVGNLGKDIAMSRGMMTKLEKAKAE